MSKTLTLGPVTLAWPLRIRANGMVVDADGYTVTTTTLPMLLASPDLLLAAEAVLACGLSDMRLDPEQSAALAALREQCARARGST